MDAKLKELLVAAYNNAPVSGTNFSAEDTQVAAFKELLKTAGLSDNPTFRDLRSKEDVIFSLIEETIDEILPAKLQGVLQEFAEVRTFPRDAEVIFSIDKIGKNRAKLTISKGARGGLYRSARLYSKKFTLATHVETVGVFVTLEEILSGSSSLAELWNNILEGFQELIYKEVFNALATGVPVAGYNRIDPDGSGSITTVSATLGESIDKVMPYVRQYGAPVIFGSYQALSVLKNPAAENYPQLEDSTDRRNQGYISIYKGCRLVELPNYLIDNTNKNWFYDPKYVFVLPTGAKPVKVALKGELMIQRNEGRVGDQRWDASKMVGVGLAMANNFAVIEVTDLE